jgi:signal transduction histidine kinase
VFLLEDDGIGFEAKDAVPGDPVEKGLGLETMKGRAQMIGGTLDMHSREGKGTRIALTIPIDQGGTL